ncbi:MAG: ABC-2 family transporter protein [Chloroflexi bacterium]|nr:ABC-2 family transporter protein [Chloroflexota bacterium]
MLIKYAVLLRRSFSAMLEYRAMIFIWMLTNVMPLVMLAVWFSLSEGGPIAGYSQNDFVAYYLLITFVRQMTNVWVIWEIDYEIRHGDFSIKLLHPLNPIHEYIASHITDKFLRLAVMIPLGIFAWIIFPTIHYDLTFTTVTLFLIALVASWLIRFLSQYCFGLLAFWISASTTLNEIWFATSLMLGGIVAPLDLFPANIQLIAKYLPFRYMFAFPVEIVSGRLAQTELINGLAAMLGWLIVSVVVYRWLWRRGLKHFSAFGA